MTASTPFLTAAAKLAPLASRNVEVSALPWQPMRWPGVEMKVLLEDQETGLLTALVRMRPAIIIPTLGSNAITAVGTVQDGLPGTPGEPGHRSGPQRSQGRGPRQRAQSDC